MTEEDIRKVVVYTLSRQPRFSVERQKHDQKVTSDSHYWCGLYNRRIELFKGCREYAEKMDEIYIINAIRELIETKTPEE